MKKLLLLRGAPASGKSTLIKDNNLEPYVISSDNLRLMVAGLSMDLDGNMKTSQDLNRKVWEFLGEILDERMRYGATTVIDATHNSTKSFKKYKPLAEKYGYKVYCITFTAPIPELMRRNAARPTYKVVPPDCIYAMAHKVESQPTPDWVKDINTLDVNDISTLKDLSEQNNCSFVFEVCHVDDKHIIDFNENRLYLLDAIPNTYNTAGITVNTQFSQAILQQVKPVSEALSLKEELCTFNDRAELDAYVDAHKNDHTLEGMVLVDNRGYMCKEKFLYYVKVKQLRGFLQRCIKAHLKGQPLPNPKQEFMSDIVDKVLHSGYFTDEELENLHVIDAVKYYEANFKKLSF